MSGLSFKVSQMTILSNVFASAYKDTGFPVKNVNFFLNLLTTETMTYILSFCNDNTMLLESISVLLRVRL